LQPWTLLYSHVVLDDGSGPALYIAGRTQQEYWLSRWNGQDWTRVWPGIVSCVHNDCIGPIFSIDLGAGTQIYGMDIRTISPAVVRWDNEQWVSIGTANHRNAWIYALDLGDGPGLYALGRFTTIGGVSSRGFARWTGTQWIDLSTSGFTITGIWKTLVMDHGNGPNLYLSGYISGTSGPEHGLKRWLGPALGWEHVGAHFGSAFGVEYRGVQVFDDGRGPAIYMIGSFDNINGIPVTGGIARYDGVSWSALPPGLPRPYFIGSLDMVQGPSLVVFAEEGMLGSGVLYAYQYVGCPNCYANCDASTVEPRLNIDDFTCFINKFVARDPYANCDQSTTLPTLTIDDFTCFINRFAQGCP
jgi:hypothetical protein